MPTFNKLNALKFENLKKLTLALFNLSIKPMLNRSTNCILIFSVICKMIGDKNLSQQNCLFLPSFKSFKKWYAYDH